jgi:glycosyltransferase involved in cell wall biosynthesis
LGIKISVITPVYNGEEYIEETIISVLSTISNSKIEYIVINDGSTDSTLEILNKYSGQIKIISQPNSGESSAVNTGIFAAEGEYILIVSADDPLFTSDIFNGVEEFFALNKNIVAWYPNWRMIDESGKKIKIVEVLEFSNELMVGRFQCLPGPGTIFRKNAAIQIGGRNSKWTFVGDYDFWLRLSRVGNFAKRNQVLAQWRLHPQSSSISRRGVVMANERIAVIEDFTRLFSMPASLRRKALSHAYYFAARLVLFDPKIKGKRLIIKAFIIRRMIIEESKLLVVLYILFTPISRYILFIFRPILIKYNRYINL